MKMQSYVVNVSTKCHHICLAIRDWKSWSIKPHKRLSFFFRHETLCESVPCHARDPTSENQNLQAQIEMVTTTPTCWEPRNTFEVRARGLPTFRVEREPEVFHLCATIHRII
jgi:hypothetical protein